MPLRLAAAGVELAIDQRVVVLFDAAIYPVARSALPDRVDVARPTLALVLIDSLFGRHDSGGRAAQGRHLCQTAQLVELLLVLAVTGFPLGVRAGQQRVSQRAIEVGVDLLAISISALTDAGMLVILVSSISSVSFIAK